MATPTTIRATAGSLVLAGALLLGACGSSDGAEPDDPPASLGATPSSSESSSAPDGPTIGGAEVFVDPEGTYSIEISPEWTEVSGATIDGVEAWRIGVGTAEFQDNVNVLTQTTPGADLESYLEASIEQLGDLQLINSTVTTGANGNELGLVEYAGMVPTAPIPVHALASVMVADGKAVVATLTADESTFAEARTVAEDYLLTLQPAR